jgi:hypothetical protein
LSHAAKVQVKSKHAHNFCCTKRNGKITTTNTFWPLVLQCSFSPGHSHEGNAAKAGSLSSNFGMLAGRCSRWGFPLSNLQNGLEIKVFKACER